MAKQLSKAHQILVARNLAKAGFHNTPASNSWLHKGAQAELIQGLIAEEDPVAAAEMRVAASEVNGGIPAAVLLIQSGEMQVQDQAQHEMMVAWDPEYSAGFLAAQKHQDDAALKAMEASAEAMRKEALLLQSGGNQARAEMLLRQEQEAAEKQQAQAASNAADARRNEELVAQIQAAHRRG